MHCGVVGEAKKFGNKWLNYYCWKKLNNDEITLLVVICWFPWFERYQIIMVHALPHLPKFYFSKGLIYFIGKCGCSQSHTIATLLSEMVDSFFC